MEYRRLGNSGLKVSVLSFGSWVTFGPQVNGSLAEDCLDAAYKEGVNFFDNAEAYSSGQSERIMGQAISNLGWPRHSFVVSTKLYWGIHDAVNMKNTLNRKYLMQAIDGSLDRLNLDFVDIVYCHRPDPDTPIEEVVWAMSDIIAAGKALYWGTSEFSAAEIEEACAVADRLNLRKPIVEQPQYNLLNREKVEVEFASLYESRGLGLTTWSPLASGLLTGKYANGIPEDSRGALEGYEWLRKNLTDADKNKRITDLKSVADRFDCTVAQLSIAWCAANPHVSTVITGASRVEQVHENLAAVRIIPLITPSVKAEIDDILGM